MFYRRVVFAQLMDFLPRREFNSCVRKYRGDRPGRGFSCCDQFLCLSLFPRGTFRRRKGTVKLHVLLDLRGNIPCLVHISPGKMCDVNVLDQLPIEPGAFYVMDRGYIDFQRLFRFTMAATFFVTRGKRNLDCTRHAHTFVDKDTGLRSDQTIVLAGLESSRSYPDPLRRIAFYDEEHQRRLVFLTNNFTLPALTIARLYQCRWQVEMYFKWPARRFANPQPHRAAATANNAVASIRRTGNNVAVAFTFQRCGEFTQTNVPALGTSLRALRRGISRRRR